MVMKMEKVNIPPRPYRCSVRLPDLSIRGIEMSVMMTITQPIPIVANFALDSLKPVMMKRFVE